MTSNWDATTVDGSASVAGPKDTFSTPEDPKLQHFNGKRPEGGDKALRVPTVNFGKEIDYSLTDRPLFVVVGKDGMLAALQKLDRQLRNVSVHHLVFHSLFRTEVECLA